MYPFFVSKSIPYYSEKGWSKYQKYFLLYGEKKVSTSSSSKRASLKVVIDTEKRRMCCLLCGLHRKALKTTHAYDHLKTHPEILAWEDRSDSWKMECNKDYEIAVENRKSTQLPPTVVNANTKKRASNSTLDGRSGWLQKKQKGLDRDFQRSFVSGVVVGNYPLDCASNNEGMRMILEASLGKCPSGISATTVTRQVMAMYDEEMEVKAEYFATILDSIMPMGGGNYSDGYYSKKKCQASKNCCG